MIWVWSRWWWIYHQFSAFFTCKILKLMMNSNFQTSPNTGKTQWSCGCLPSFWKNLFVVEPTKITYWENSQQNEGRTLVSDTPFVKFTQALLTDIPWYTDITMVNTTINWDIIVTYPNYGWWFGTFFPMYWG